MTNDGYHLQPGTWPWALRPERGRSRRRRAPRWPAVRRVLAGRGG
jgi:hypothetical protein